MRADSDTRLYASWQKGAEECRGLSCKLWGLSVEGLGLYCQWFMASGFRVQESRAKERTFFSGFWEHGDVQLIGSPPFGRFFPLQPGGFRTGSLPSDLPCSRGLWVLRSALGPLISVAPLTMRHGTRTEVPLREAALKPSQELLPELSALIHKL